MGAYGPEIFRFVDAASESANVRLNLLDPSGWMLGRGLDLGRRTLERVYLQQPPYEGATLAAAYAGLVQMVVPLHLMAQTSSDNIRTKVTALKTELDRTTNFIEYRPKGGTTGDSFFISTFRADVPSILAGVNMPGPFTLGGSAGPLVVIIDRLPTLQGAAAHI